MTLGASRNAFTLYSRLLNYTQKEHTRARGAIVMTMTRRRVLVRAPGGDDFDTRHAFGRLTVTVAPPNNNRTLAAADAADSRNDATRKALGNALVERCSSRLAHIFTSVDATKSAKFPALLALRGIVTPFRRSNAFMAFCAHTREYSFNRSRARRLNQNLSLLAPDRAGTSYFS